MPIPDGVSSRTFSRRQWLQAIGLQTLGISLVPALTAGEEQQLQENTLLPLNRFPRMVQEHFVDQVPPASVFSQD